MLLLSKLRSHFNWKHSCSRNCACRKFNWKHSYLQNCAGISIENTHAVLTKQWTYFNWRPPYLRNCKSISVENTHTVLTELRTHFSWKHSYLQNSADISIENTLTYQAAKAFQLKGTLLDVRNPIDFDATDCACLWPVIVTGSTANDNILFQYESQIVSILHET